MKVSEFEIPVELVDLIESGWWPSDVKAMMNQNSQSLVEAENVQSLSQQYSKIYFVMPPFEALDTSSVGEYFDFFSICQSQEGHTDLAKLVDIGYLAEAAPLVLDYRYGNENPSVMYLEFTSSNSAVWKKCASNFSELLTKLKIET